MFSLVTTLVPLAWFRGNGPAIDGTVTVGRRAKLTIGSYAGYQKQGSLRYLKIICSRDLAYAQLRRRSSDRIIENGYE